MAKKERGFTIVELLVVVIVISILATITVAAYNGVQDRAKRVSAFQAANETAKLLTAYVTTNGSYPAFAADTCLGGYRADNLCRGTAGLTPARDANFETAIKTTGNLPNFPVDNTGDYSGLILTREIGRTFNGQLAEYTIKFYLSGVGAKCAISNSVRWTGSVYIAADYDSTWPSTTQCKILLPQPSAV